MGGQSSKSSRKVAMHGGESPTPFPQKVKAEQPSLTDMLRGKRVLFVMGNQERKSSGPFITEFNNLGLAGGSKVMKHRDFLSGLAGFVREEHLDGDVPDSGPDLIVIKTDTMLSNGGLGKLKEALQLIQEEMPSTIVMLHIGKMEHFHKHGDALLFGSDEGSLFNLAHGLVYLPDAKNMDILRQGANTIERVMEQN